MKFSSQLFADLCRPAVLLTVVTLLNSCPAAAASWHSAFDARGLKIETRDVTGSGVQSFRATTTLNASLGTVLAVISDPAHYSQWVYGCKLARTLSRHGFGERLVYEVNRLPWPFSNRDMVVQVRIRELNSGTFRVDLINRPHKLPTTDNVRIMESMGHYLLTPLGAVHTRLVWEQHTDPGGHLPNWLINQLLVQVPEDTIEGMRAMVGKPAFAGWRLERDSGGRLIGLERAGTDRQTPGTLAGSFSNPR